MSTYVKSSIFSVEPKKPTSVPNLTTNLNQSVEPEEGGFGNFEMTRPAQRPNFASIRNGAAKNIYARLVSYC